MNTFTTYRNCHTVRVVRAETEHESVIAREVIQASVSDYKEVASI